MDQTTATRFVTTIETPIGRLTLIASERGLTEVHFPGGPPVDGAVGDDHRVLLDVKRQLTEYFAGERTDFDIPLDLVGTPFQIVAWRALTTIPYAETVSYGEQARRLGDRRKARAVGAANGRNPIPVVVPCHRVVGADGSLTGFGGGMATKAWLLAHEQRVAGRQLCFDPGA